MQLSLCHYWGVHHLGGCSPNWPVVLVCDDQGFLDRLHPRVVDKAVAKVVFFERKVYSWLDGTATKGAHYLWSILYLTR